MEDKIFGEFWDFNPLMQAFKTLWGLDEPSDFATTSCIPKTSHADLIAPPAMIPVPEGAGKGTQSNFIVAKFNLYQLSTGELLRNEIQNKTKLGQEIKSIMDTGNLVSNEIVSDLIEKYISDTKYNNKIIFDGYPRNLNQAKNLDVLLKKYNQKIDLALKLSVTLKTIKKRISERKLQEKRSDDLEEIAVKRFETYEKNINPVIDFYKQSKLLKVINGEGSITQINNEISEIIEGIKG